MKAAGALTKSSRGRVYEMNGNSLAFRLLEFEGNPRLRVFANFKRPAAGRTSRFGQNLLMLLQLARRIVGSSRPLIEPA